MRRRIAACLASLLLLSACSQAPETTVIPTELSTAIRTEIPEKQTKAIITANPSSPTAPLASATPTRFPPTPVQTRMRPAQPTLEPVAVLEKTIDCPVWSPIQDALAFYQTDVEKSTTYLAIASGPDFLPTVVTRTSFNPCVWYPNDPNTGTPDAIAWSQNGHQIYFSGLLPGFKDGGQAEMSDLWVVDRDGSNPHPLASGKFVKRWLSFYGVMDDQVLALWGYEGGGSQSLSLINTDSKQKIEQKLFYGSTVPASHSYLPFMTFNETVPMVPSAMYAYVMAKVPQSPRLPSFVSTYIRRIPLPRPQPGSVEESLFEDWMPSSQNMLVYGRVLLEAQPKPRCDCGTWIPIK